MKRSVPRLCGLLALLAMALVSGRLRAQGENSATPKADELLVQAIAAVERPQTITAKVRHRSELFGEQVVGTGTYVQGPARMNLCRLELQIQLGQQASSILQVCDGKQLWTHRDVLGDQRITSLDLARVAEARKNGPAAPQPPMPTSLGLGGLPQLLQGLQESMQFTTVKETRLEKFPVWAVEGTWKPLKLIHMLHGQLKEIAAQKPLDLSQLPEHMPDHVVLYLGRDDLFPYRVEYRRMTGEAKSRDGKNSAASSKALVTMEWYEVATNARVDAALFAFHPGERRVVDQTDAFLTARGLARKE